MYEKSLLVYLRTEGGKISGRPAEISDRVEKPLIMDLERNLSNFSRLFGLGQMNLELSKYIEKLAGPT